MAALNDMSKSALVVIGAAAGSVLVAALLLVMCIAFRKHTTRQHAQMLKQILGDRHKDYKVDGNNVVPDMEQGPGPTLLGAMVLRAQQRELSDELAEKQPGCPTSVQSTQDQAPPISIAQQRQALHWRAPVPKVTTQQAPPQCSDGHGVINANSRAPSDASSGMSWGTDTELPSGDKPAAHRRPSAPHAAQHGVDRKKMAAVAPSPAVTKTYNNQLYEGTGLPASRFQWPNPPTSQPPPSPDVLPDKPRATRTRRALTPPQYNPSEPLPIVWRRTPPQAEQGHHRRADPGPGRAKSSPAIPASAATALAMWDAAPAPRRSSGRGASPLAAASRQGSATSSVASPGGVHFTPDMFQPVGYPSGAQHVSHLSRAGPGVGSNDLWYPTGLHAAMMGKQERYAAPGWAVPVCAQVPPELPRRVDGRGAPTAAASAAARRAERANGVRL